MTESSPIGAVGAPLSAQGEAEETAPTVTRASQGHAPFGIELRLVDDAGRRVPHDGLTRGQLCLRGPWVPAGYFKATGAPPLDADGFFASGDIATIDGKGWLRVTDRAADALKSGGEWMSFAELEAIAVSHPDVFEAALIALPGTPSRTHQLLIIVRRSSCEVSREELLDYLAQRLDRRWLPDDVVFVEHIPHTATGKVRKGQLQEMFAGHP